MPFFVKVPGIAPTESDIAVSGADIYPTVLDLLGLTSSAHQVDGRACSQFFQALENSRSDLYSGTTHTMATREEEPSSIIRLEDWRADTLLRR